MTTSKVAQTVETLERHWLMRGAALLINVLILIIVPFVGYLVARTNSNSASIALLSTRISVNEASAYTVQTASEDAKIVRQELLLLNQQLTNQIRDLLKVTTDQNAILRDQMGTLVKREDVPPVWVKEMLDRHEARIIALERHLDKLP